MDGIFAFFCEHAEYAHLIIFGLIMLAGFSIPISEDLMLLLAGGIASTCVPEQATTFYIWIFFACWLSAWEAYWVGRLLGPKLFKIKWFHHILSPKRLEKLKRYLRKFGIFTFIVGRFIPGGVRNAIFMSSGLTKMPFHIFVIRDGIACLIASLTIFYVGFISGQHINVIMHYFVMYERVIILLIIILLITFSLFTYHRIKKSKLTDGNTDLQ